VATLAADEVQYCEAMTPKEQWDAKTALLRRYAPVELDELQAGAAHTPDEQSPAV